MVDTEPQTKENVNILDNLPKNSPAWSTGIVSILICAGMIFGIAWPLVKDQIATSNANSYELNNKKMDMNQQLVTSVFGMAQSNNEQIILLNKRNLNLEEDMTKLRQDMDTAKVSLSECRNDLIICKGKGK